MFSGLKRSLPIIVTVRPVVPWGILRAVHQTRKPQPIWGVDTLRRMI